VLSFGNDAAALAALHFGLLAFDRTHCGRLRVSGAGREALLSLCEGAGEVPAGESAACSLQLRGGALPCRLLALESSHLLLLPPGGAALAAAALPSGAAADVGSATACFALLGPGVDAALRRLGAGAVQPDAHRVFGFQGAPVVLLAAADAPGQRGATLLADESVAGALWATLTGPLGALPAGERVWLRL